MSTDGLKAQYPQSEAEYKLQGLKDVASEQGLYKEQDFADCDDDGRSPKRDGKQLMHNATLTTSTTHVRAHSSVLTASTTPSCVIQLEHVISPDLLKFCLRPATTTARGPEIFGDEAG